MTVSWREIQLYDPVRRYWSAAGYEVRGEVSGCDVVACSGDTIIAIELKTSLNLDVILQATQRQKISSQTWIAVPRPGRASRSRRWQRLLHLLQRLELGLLLVDLNLEPPCVEAVLLALPFDRALSRSRCQARSRQLRQEFERRHGDRNQGGVHRTRLMTVYREQSLLVAALLARTGTASAAQLRRCGSPAKTYGILYDNHYCWFVKNGFGQYALTAAGQAALAEEAELAGQLLAEAAAALPGSAPVRGKHAGFALK